jgi:hypothetical protein
MSSLIKNRNALVIGNACRPAPPTVDYAAIFRDLEPGKTKITASGMLYAKTYLDL